MRSCRHCRWLPIVAGLLCGSALAGPSAAAAVDGVESPIEARFPAPVIDVVTTPGLQPGRASFTSNDELEASLRALAARSGGPQLIEAGRSQRGTALLALHFGPGEAGRPTALLIGQQHGDEPAGAEALLALAAQLAGGAETELLRRIDIVLLPRANPDGAADAVRNTADDLDLNRDHLLLRTPEARAIAALTARFAPLLVVDLHEYRVTPRFRQKFGAVERADLLLQTATTANLQPAVRAMAETGFRQPLVRALAQAGFSSELYHVDALDPDDLRLAMGTVAPDTLRNVQGLRHAVSFLLESRSGGESASGGPPVTRRHLQRRVQSQLAALRSLLHSAADRAEALIAMRAQADADVTAAACKGRVLVLAGRTLQRRDLTMIDPTTGADRSVKVDWLAAEPLRPLIERSRPCGYWLEAGAQVVVAQLRRLGLRVDSLPAAQTLPAERWQERFEIGNRSGLRLVQATTVSAELQAAAGSFRVPLEQPLANLAVAALEPDTPFSDYAHRLLPGLSSTARLMASPPAASAAFDSALVPARSAEQRAEHAADQLAPGGRADAAHR
ncbi:MAG: succinylglutamate desuccinylase/aspartoacylase family protein [Pseudomonadota bacterium]|nr:succinylglutamate desuccinylase/aspartoacylase family protein [Pseudomonadota bacterium]